MGNFSSLCSHCNESIKEGELCVLTHQRHGIEIGRAVGHYAGYGNVKEDTVFRSGSLDGPNSHSEICDSEFGLADSRSGLGYRVIFEDQIVIVSSLLHRLKAIARTEALKKEIAEWNADDPTTRDKLRPSYFDERFDCENVWEEGNHQAEFEKLIETLEKVPARSGVIDCHLYCHDRLSPEERANLQISNSDPDQGWGKPNPKFT